MSKRRMNILFGALALVLGTSLYIVFRGNTYVGRILDGLYLIDIIRIGCSMYATDFLKYYFPDFLWALALGSGLYAICNPSKEEGLLCGCSTFFCGCLWELLQYFRIVSGTGDVLDIMMYLFASFFITIINLKESKDEKN